jgi:2-polyprenyl-3-methyl-5-hydroxy-6-metoxy-1,4-benzoquinol methylase
MGMTQKQEHWDTVYSARTESALTWFEDNPTMSRAILAAAGVTSDARVIDVGGGASRLVDALITDGFKAITVLDLSAQALALSKDRLAERGESVQWVASDITEWHPDGLYDVWHDRAVFHFLTDPKDRAAYIQTLTQTLRPGGVAVIGTFALDGPEKCSNLPVVRYSPETLTQTLGDGFARVECQRDIHETPLGRSQPFTFCAFRRL